MADPRGEYPPAHKSLSLLRHSARVSPILRDAVDEVERHVRLLEQANENVVGQFQHVEAEADLLRAALEAARPNVDASLSMEAWCKWWETVARPALSGSSVGDGR